MLKKIFAFIRKDFLLESSYGLNFLFNIFGVLASILSYFFIDKLFGYTITTNLEEFGVNYFAYVLLGMAFFSYIGASLGSFSERLYAEQIQGTLESILSAPISTTALLLSFVLGNLLIASLNAAIYLVLGHFFFGIDFSHANIASTLVILLLTIISFSSLGIISASFILVFKRGNPLSWIIGTLEGLLGGVYFPITVLPAWLQGIAKLFPIVYAIRGLQFAVYKGYGIMQLKTEILFLLFFSVLLLPLSVKAFEYALKKARLSGTLSQY
ncbi:MAG: ABC transporter permease [Candidatus Omnitrophica bacterium]|nr:ABC transporter permease [Candidatus Omnitrophota bacterium]